MSGGGRARAEGTCASSLPCAAAAQRCHKAAEGRMLISRREGREVLTRLRGKVRREIHHTQPVIPPAHTESNILHYRLADSKAAHKPWLLSLLRLRGLSVQHLLLCPLTLQLRLLVSISRRPHHPSSTLSPPLPDSFHIPPRWRID